MGQVGFVAGVGTFQTFQKIAGQANALVGVGEEGVQWGRGIGCCFEHSWQSLSV
jgi:hypothetical protein